MIVPVLAKGHAATRIALALLAIVAILLVLAQALLPRFAATRMRDTVAKYGVVQSASVSAWPAIELLWGRAGSANVSAASLSATPAQIGALLWEARGVERLTVTARQATLRLPALAGGLTLSDIRLAKTGEVVQASATMTQAQLDAALAGGLSLRPLGSRNGQIELRASGGLFGVRASIAAVVRQVEGRLVAEPQNVPFASLGQVTLFSDPHLKVQSVGLTTTAAQPLTYRLSMVARLS